MIDKYLKIIPIILFIFVPKSLWASVCRIHDKALNEKYVNTRHYSPYEGAIYVSSLSTIVLGMTMPVNEEEHRDNSVGYTLLGFYGLLQYMNIQFLSCAWPTDVTRAEGFFKRENIDAQQYNKVKKNFWWSYGLNVTAITYMASVSKREDRWQRVQAVVLLPWIYDLIVNRMILDDKYQLYENPIFMDIKTDPETKEPSVGLNYRFTY